MTAAGLVAAVAAVSIKRELEYLAVVEVTAFVSAMQGSMDLLVSTICK